MQIHTEGIEAIWKHAKAHLKKGGGSIEMHIQERLDEYVFHRTYLRDKPLNVWIMLRLLAKYGNKAYDFVCNDKGIENLTEEEKRRKTNYRAEYIGDTDEDDDADDVDMKMDEFNRWQVDEDGNLLHLDEEGNVESTVHIDPAAQQQQQSVEEEENGDTEIGDLAIIDPDLASRIQSFLDNDS